MGGHRSVEFFDEQFRRQLAAGEFTLNPFERLALPFVSGRVLELGCGLGNLSLEAARRGCAVTAMDASPAAVERLARASREESLPLSVRRQDITGYCGEGEFDTVIAIGLVMFFPCVEAHRLLDEIRRAVAAGGRAIVNSLVAGTTWLEPFQPDAYCLLPEGAIERAFAGWRIDLAHHASFPAPGGTLKQFDTVIAQRP